MSCKKNWWTSENNPMNDPKIVEMVRQKNIGKKLSKEQRMKISKANTGNPKVRENSMKGVAKLRELRKNPEYMKKVSEKNRASAKRQWSNPKIRDKMRKAMKGKKHGPISEEQRQFLSNFFSKRHKGRGNPAWRGGISFKYGDDWDAIRLLVYMRDRFTCRNCGITGVPMDIHHIIPFRVSKNSNLENLMTVCKKCHRSLDVEYQRQEQLIPVRGLA